MTNSYMKWKLVKYYNVLLGYFTNELVCQKTVFVKWCAHNEIQSNSKVYSSFASIYINSVIN